MSGIQAKAIPTFDALPEGAVSTTWPNHALPKFVLALRLSKVSSCGRQGACSAWKYGHK